MDDIYLLIGHTYLCAGYCGSEKTSWVCQSGGGGCFVLPPRSRALGVRSSLLSYAEVGMDEIYLLVCHRYVCAGY